MGKAFTVTLEEVERGSKDMLGLADEYEGIYIKLMQLATEMGEAWEGEDNQAFVNQIKQLTTHLEKMTEQLREAGRKLQEQKNNYEERQGQNKQEAGSLPTSMQ